MAIVTKKKSAPKKEEAVKVVKGKKSAADAEEPKKLCTQCKKEYPLKDFPRRSDRKGGQALHSYCRSCKSRYETEKRIVGAVRNLANQQRATLPKKGAIKVYEDGAEVMTIERGDKPLIRFEDDENGYEINLTDEGRRKLIIALGGVAL